MGILKFNEFNSYSLEEGLLKVGSILNLKFTTSEGNEIITKCKLVEYGWGHNRKPVNYIFEILESTSEEYNIGAQFILGFNFNGNEESFLFCPNMTGKGAYCQKHYKSKIEIC